MLNLIAVFLVTVFIVGVLILLTSAVIDLLKNFSEAPVVNSAVLAIIFSFILLIIIIVTSEWVGR
jgi:hypothetical protein